MIDDTPDFHSCSLAELVIMRGRIKRAKFPNRYTELVAEIEKREANLSDSEKEQLQCRMEHNRKIRSISSAFLAVGCFLFVYCFIEPTIFTLKSRNWTPTKCQIIYRAPSPSSYKKVKYSYVFKGERYEGERLSSSPSSVDGNWWKRNYPNNSSAQCWVNPDNPQQSVLTWGWSAALIGTLLWSISAVIGGYRSFRFPEQSSFNRSNPWTEQERKRLAPKKRAT